jgi:hypothetical protein
LRKPHTFSEARAPPKLHVSLLKKLENGVKNVIVISIFGSFQKFPSRSLLNGAILPDKSEIIKFNLFLL